MTEAKIKNINKSKSKNKIHFFENIKTQFRNTPWNKIAQIQWWLTKC